MTDPLLSIITVTYNAESYLLKTLESIDNQDFESFELIIIDGNSSDATLDLLKEFTHLIGKCVSEEDLGIYDAMNKGLALAKGKYVQFMNAGDYYVDSKTLSTIFSDLTHSLDIIYGDIFIKTLDDKSIYQAAGSFTTESLLKKGTGVLCHQAIFVRKDIAPKYDLRYRYKAELNWYFDLAQLPSMQVKHIDTPVVFYSLGGFGHKHFLKNRLEWIYLIYRRFGLKTLYESRLILFLLKNGLHRYPFLNGIIIKLKKLLTLGVK